MLGLGKKTNQPPRPQERPVVSPKVVEKIQTLPNRFYITPKKKKNNKLFVILGLAIILIGVVVISAIFIYRSMAIPFVEDLTNSVDAVDLSEQAAESTVPAETNVNSAASAVNAVNIPPENILVNSTPNENVNTNPALLIAEPAANTNISEPVPVPEPLPVSGSEDADFDQLTLNEEKLYNANFSNKDTDNDGYSDGSEVINGYNPGGAGTLLSAGLVSEFLEIEGYEFWYPVSWLAQKSVTAQGGIIDLDSKAGETIQIIFNSNSEKLLLRDYISANYPAMDLAQYQTLSLNGFSGLKDAAGTKYFLNPKNSNTVIIFWYDEIQAPVLSFRSTLEMMVKSLKTQK